MFKKIMHKKQCNI